MRIVAVIGFGNIATRHRKNLKKLFPQCKLIAMSASGRIPTEQINDCDEIVSSIEEIIKFQPKLTIVASAASHHALHALPLIEAGIPVLIEKPLSMELSDSIILEDAALRYGTPVCVGYCLRYLSSALVIKGVLDSKEIGRVYNAHIEIGQYLPDWRPNKDYRESVSAQAHLGGGALLELSHELDYAQWLLGPLKLQHAILRTSEELALDVEDSADLVMVSKQSTLVNIHLDFLQRKAYRKCRFVGNAGVLEWDLIENNLRLIHPDGERILYSDSQWDKNQMYLNMIIDFVKNIEGKPHSCIDIKQARRTVSLIEAIKIFDSEKIEPYK
ncbi:oxidoreductase [Enterovibrio norvegicus FF-454]|uniref:Oxidoreductase n=1 Tax=Enterovibrio norvegicus FF-454 TaxID=1185651 RepID=A0A1E5C6G0_9GAMM|nr:Gfo/Idh/MocA family oxidoreductase [Enterovibrio norvegicus]OEE61098.1 oxidoreductase [Enterovibrio norvegicus FF-454]